MTWAWRGTSPTAGDVSLDTDVAGSGSVVMSDPTEPEADGLASGERTPGDGGGSAAGAGDVLATGLGTGLGVGAGAGLGVGAGVGLGVGAGWFAAGGCAGEAAAGGVLGAGAGDAGGVDGAADDGKGVSRAGSNVSGSTYVSLAPARTPRWTYGTVCSASPDTPLSATTSPSSTCAPRRTSNGPTCVSDALCPSAVVMVTVKPCVGT